MDVGCLVIGCLVGVLLRFPQEEIGEYVFGQLPGWLIFCGSVILANYLAGSYQIQYTFSRFNLVVTWLFSLLFALLILGVTSYAWFRILLGRGVLLLAVGSYSGLALALKLLVYRSLFRSEVFTCRTVIIGTGPEAEGIRSTLEHDWVMPAHKVVAYVRPVPAVRADGATNRSVLNGVAVIECAEDGLSDIVHSLGVNLIVIGVPDATELSHYYGVLKRLRFEGIEVLTRLNVAEIYSGRTPIDLLNDEFLMDASLESGLPMLRRTKRLMDILSAVLGCVLLFPLALCIGLLIKLCAPGSPVLYRQTRVGQFGRLFTIYKFRTMCVNAEDETGPVWATVDDPRITWLGRILRRTRLDELPQFMNVLKGDMSLVGPRPERPELVAELEDKIPYYSERANITPGLTGWAQIQYPYGSSIEDTARKLEYDLFYIKNLSVSLDLQIILRTLRIVVLGMERRVA